MFWIIKNSKVGVTGHCVEDLTRKGELRLLYWLIEVD